MPDFLPGVRERREQLLGAPRDFALDMDRLVADSGTAAAAGPVGGALGGALGGRSTSPESNPLTKETTKGGFIVPVEGRITSRFGYRVHPISGVRKLHAGVDIAAATGTPIHAAAGGVVLSAGWRGGYGNAVTIDHGGGVTTLYGHCSSLVARRGQEVRQGELIAYVGSTGHSTGPHCHWEVRRNGTPIDPL